MKRFAFSKADLKKSLRKAGVILSIIFASTIGSTLIASSFSTCTNEVNASIVRNNNKSKYNETYWSISVKNNKISWSTDSYAYTLQGFAGTWHDELEVPTNYGFLINNSVNEVFISSKNGGEPLGVKVIGDAYRGTASRFGFKLKNKTKFDTYYNFYCSEKVYEFLGENQDCSLKVKGNKDNKSVSIHFEDIIESVESPLINELIGDSPYIVVPAEGKGFTGYTSYDNLNITGNTRFIFAFKSDKYQNEFSLNRVNYFVHREKFSTRYEATFMDKPEDITKVFTSIKSETQDIYLSYGTNMDVFVFKGVNFGIGIGLIVISLIVLAFAFKYKWFVTFNHLLHYSFFSVLITLVIYWIVGQILYKVGSSFSIWASLNRMITVLWSVDLACIISLLGLLFAFLERKKEEKQALELVEQEVEKEGKE